MSNVLLLGAPNLHARVQDDTQIYTIGTAATTMPITNLHSEQPSRPARLTDIGWEASAFYATYWVDGALTTFPVDGSGLVAHNLSRGATVRMVAFDTEAVPFLHAELLAPDAILAQSGLSGAVATVQSDPRTGDGTWMTNTGGASASLRCSFGSITVAHELQTGTSSQAFLIRARRTGSGAPTITVRLYESGSLVATLLSNQVISDNTGQLVTVLWDGASLASATGANTEILIEITADGASSIDLNGLGWMAYLFPDFVSVIGDTGWVDVPRFDGDEEFADLATLEEPPVQTALFRFAARVEGCQQLALMIRDADNADAYLEIGCWPAGPIWASVGGLEAGPILGLEQRSTAARAMSGTEYALRLREPREFPVVLPYLTEQEGLALFERVLRRKSGVGPVLLQLLPDSATASAALTAWVRLKSWSDLQLEDAFDAEGGPVTAVTLRFVEKL